MVTEELFPESECGGFGLLFFVFLDLRLTVFPLLVVD